MRFVRFALKVAMQNDGVFVAVMCLYLCISTMTANNGIVFYS